MLINICIDNLGVQGGKKSSGLQRYWCTFGNFSSESEWSLSVTWKVEEEV